MENQKSSKSKVSFLDMVKEGFKPTKSTKMYPWIQSGILLIGFSAGVFVTTTVDLVSRILPRDAVITEVSAEDKCRSQGGRYDTTNEECLLVTSDRGANCKSNSDCSGWCLAYDYDELGQEKDGFCSDSFNMKGCFKYIDEGKVNSICMPE